MKFLIVQRKGALISALLLISLIATPYFAIAQFGYAGLGIGYRAITFKSGNILSGDKPTKARAITLDADLMYRPYRFFALGATISIPLTEFSTYSFSGAKTSKDQTFDGFFPDFPSGNLQKHQPEDMDYSFDQSFSATLKARFYAVPQIGLYFDLRYTLMSITETFKFGRLQKSATYYSGGTIKTPDVSGEKLYASSELNPIIPGLGIGFKFHVSKSVYLDVNSSLDLVLINNYEGFEFDVSYDYDYTDRSRDFVRLRSQAPGTHSSFVFHIGGGYLF